VRGLGAALAVPFAATETMRLNQSAKLRVYLDFLSRQMRKRADWKLLTGRD
jgi:hypothetical protein